MSDITLFQHNLSPTISDVLTREDGSIYDLTNCSLQFRMRREDSAALEIDNAASIIDAAEGVWTYSWQEGDTDVPGTFKAWLVVTPQGSQPQDTPEFTVTILSHAPLQVGSGYARTYAREKIRLFGDTGNCPEITEPTEIEFLLDMGRVVDRYGAPPPKGFTWYSGCSLGLGAFVVPSTPNDHYYKVTALSSAPGYTEPTWPTVSGEEVVQDGVTYVEQGTMQWEETYDANYCIAQVWLIKSGRLAKNYNFMVGGKMLSRQQFYDHCQKQYKMYAMKSGIKAIRLATPYQSPLAGLAGVPLWDD